MIEYGIIKPGTYILGDPCYSFEYDDWSAICDQTNCFENFTNTIYDGRYVLAFSTAYGDGSYRGTNGVEYGVDSGLIGLVEFDETKHAYDIERDDMSLITFKQETLVRNENGVMTFGDVVIDTDPQYTNEDEDEFDVDYYWRQDDED